MNTFNPVTPALEISLPGTSPTAHYIHYQSHRRHGAPYQWTTSLNSRSRIVSTPSLSASTDLRRWLTSALPRPMSLRRILFNCIFNMYSNIMDCLMTLSRTVDLNSPPVLQLGYSIFAISTVISLPPFTHNLTVKKNELIKFSNNTFEFFATINKVIGMNYYPSLSSPTTMPNTPPLKFPPSTQTTDTTHDFRCELQNATKPPVTPLRRIWWRR